MCHFESKCLFSNRGMARLQVGRVRTFLHVMAKRRAACVAGTLPSEGESVMTMWVRALPAGALTVRIGHPVEGSRSHKREMCTIEKGQNIGFG
jgi:hypothetical protein